MRMLITFLEGIAIGMCNVIPGVSGGTLVVIFNIYDDFLSIMSVHVKQTLKNWRFVLPILLGMLCGVLVFSKLITFLYTEFPVQTNYFFTGLIIGSIPLLGKYTFARKEGEKTSAVKIISSIIFIAIGFAVIYLFYVIKKNMGDNEAIQFVLPEFTWPLALKIFAAGIVGAFAMIIPGISGSLLMLIMGVYPIVIAAIPALLVPSTFLHALILLLPNGCGILIGLVGGAWLLKKLLARFPNQTYAVILGLIVGSIINIFPGFTCITGFGMGAGSVICLLAGTAMAYFSSKFGEKDDEKKAAESAVKRDEETAEVSED